MGNAENQQGKGRRRSYRNALMSCGSRRKGLVIASATSATSLHFPLYIGMHDPHVSGKGIVSAEGLLLTTVLASHLDLLTVVDGILVACQIVRSREDGVARLSGGGIDACALVRASLRVSGLQGGRSHARANGADTSLTTIMRWVGRDREVCGGGCCCWRYGRQRERCRAIALSAVNVSLVLLELCWRVEALGAALGGTCVATRCCRGIMRSLDHLGGCAILAGDGGIAHA